jgi:diguanylate cyclase (GGDEF)-like protein
MNGTFVNGNRIVGPRRVRDGDRVQVGHMLFKLEYRDAIEQELKQALYLAAAKDALTGAYNRRYLEERLEQEFAFAIRRGEPLAIVLFDIDHFKRVNDVHGHAAGDRVLEEVARRTHRSIRCEDIFGRCGGEEFVIVMRQTTLTQAALVASRISAAISASPIEVAAGLGIAVTVSTGVAERMSGAHGSPARLLHRADELLYAAKAAGRNRVLIEGAA